MPSSTRSCRRCRLALQGRARPAPSVARRRCAQPRARPAAPRGARPRRSPRTSCRCRRHRGEREGRFDRELNDDELALLFAVCHPALSPEMRVTFALKTVCGLTVPPDRRGAARASRRPSPSVWCAPGASSKPPASPIEPPPPEALPERAEAVRTALYLMFNEGYSASSGEALVQPELCVEAVRLARALAAHPMTRGPASDAHAALLALTAARLPTRVGPMAWLSSSRTSRERAMGPGLIALGFAHLERSAAGRGADDLASAGRDRLAEGHCAQPVETDWPRIASSTTSSWCSIPRRGRARPRALRSRALRGRPRDLPPCPI